MGISGLPIYPLSKGLLLNGGSLLQLGAPYKAGKGKKGKQQIEAAQREADGADYGGVVSRFMDSLVGWVQTQWIIRLGLNILLVVTGFFGDYIIWGLYDIGDYDIGLRG